MIPNLHTAIASALAPFSPAPATAPRRPRADEGNLPSIESTCQQAVEALAGGNCKPLLELWRIQQTWRKPRADETLALVYNGCEFWSVIGEFTTPGPGQAPAFIAASIRIVNSDGSQGSELIDFFSAMSVVEFERLAVEYLTEGRA